ncbi:hypothetical protein [Pseudomonas sp. 65/3-MNA-CIBAN-0223]|uniref:DUF7693 family protein n=1 Tax=Pseudomonas sp. 65/3-MNA-CIBAN-0223 TaxID=3140476 RepID=UPI003331A080
MLTAQEVYQVLRDVAMASRPMQRVTNEHWNGIYCGLMTVDVKGWMVTLFIDCGDLDYCDSCLSPDGRRYDFNANDTFDLVGLLSHDEHCQLEKMLRQI